MSTTSRRSNRENTAAGEGAPAPKPPMRLATLGVLALILATAGGVTALSVSLRAGPAPAPAPAQLATPAQAPLAGGPLDSTLAGQPRPWEYDPVGNRHWNPEPGHQHWHNGPPPAPAQTQTSSGSTLVGPITAGSGNLPPIALSPGGPQPVQQATGPQPGDPAAWEYDAAKNQHWHPGHRHWHPGEPPPPDQRQP
jgi:hypothetical protein